MKLDLSAKIVFVLLLLLVLAIALSMSGEVRGEIARTDTSSTTQNDSTITWLHTTTAGDNRFLVVDVFMSVGIYTIDTVYYNDVPMTRIINRIYSNDVGASFGLAAPPVGEYEIEVDMSGARNTAGIATSYTGVHQDSAYFDSISSGRNSAGQVPSSPPSWDGGDTGDWLHGFIGAASAQSSLTLGAGQTLNTQRLNIIPSASSCYKAASGGLDTLTFTKSDVGDAVYLAFAINAAADGGVTVGPDTAIAVAAAVDPTVVLGSTSVTPGAAAAIATAVDPVVLGGDVTVTPSASIAMAAAVNPTVATSKDWIYMAPVDSGGSNVTGDGSLGSPYATLNYITHYVLTPNTGDTVCLLEGTYPREPNDVGNSHKVRGAPDDYLVILGDPDAATKPVYDINGENKAGIHLCARTVTGANDSVSNDACYVKFKDIKFIGGYDPEGVGINIDDGGYPQAGSDSRGSPAHHIIIEDCDFSDNAHHIKMAGVDTFFITGCTFENPDTIHRHWNIDLIGCHYGTIQDCSFVGNLYANGSSEQIGRGVTVKGGSDKITVDRCFFKEAPYYGVEIGQFTGLNFFRPLFFTNDGDGEICNYESKNVSVYRCVFINISVPIAFINAKDCKVFNNSVYCPTAWNGGLPSGDAAGVRSMFWARTHYLTPSGQGSDTLVWEKGAIVKNNIFHYADPYGSDANVPVKNSSQVGGCSNTYPDSNLFTYNMWHNSTDTSLSLPDWAWMDGHVGVGSPMQCGAMDHGLEKSDDPLYTSGSPTVATDMELQSGSPAIGAGVAYSNEIYDWWNSEYLDATDYNGDAWLSPPSMGAFAAGDVSVSPEAAIAMATVVDPTTDASMTLFPAAASAVATAVNPAVDGGIAPYAPVARPRRRKHW